jgi:SAM-dependent methyltransferase
VVTGSKRSSGYDGFAWFYNRHWGAEYHRQVAPVVEKLALREIPPRAQVLDVGCGAGRMAAHLTAQGYSVTGLDNSAEMLEYARQNAPIADFLTADARDFRLEPRFHLAISLFESLNHILILEELRQVFANVRQALLPGGIFLFDLHGETAFERYWNSHHAIVESDNVCICRSRYDRTLRLGTVDLTLFRLLSQWTRSDVTIRQRFHPTDSVVSLLDGARFDSRAFNGRDDLGMTEEIGLSRTFLLCRKR